MYLTGFADEAATDIDGQIRATRELGWENIESRNIDGTNIHDLSDDAFDVVYGKLQDAGVKINCFGSTIANWGKQVDDPDESSFEEVRRAIPRMKRLGTELVRIMSYAVMKNRGPDDQMEEKRFEKVREIVAMFSGEGLTPVHENCMNYGGMGWNYTKTLLENVPNLKLVYDTGNPVFTDDRSQEPPYPKQSAREFCKQVREHIAYVHIKDCRFVAEDPDGIFPKAEFTFPGEGDGEVRETVTDLLDSGYDGGFSMEPHMAVVFHEESNGTEEDAKSALYVEYGRRFMKLIEDVWT